MCEDTLEERINAAIQREVEAWVAKQLKGQRGVKGRFDAILANITKKDVEQQIDSLLVGTFTDVICDAKDILKRRFQKELQRDVIEAFKGEWNTIKLYMIEQIRSGKGIEASSWGHYSTGRGRG